jgi:hypothetical protein
VPRKVEGTFIKTKNRTRITVKSTKGMKGVHYLRRALEAARG